MNHFTTPDFWDRYRQMPAEVRELADKNFALLRQDPLHPSLRLKKVGSFDEENLERLLLGRSPRFQALLNRSRQSIQEGKGLSEEAFWEAVRKRAQERKTAAAGRRTKRGS
jgi:uncharacterized protein (DUF2236 family)